MNRTYLKCSMQNVKSHIIFFNLYRVNAYGICEITNDHFKPQIEIIGCGKKMDEIMRQIYMIDDEFTPTLASVFSELCRFCIPLNAVN